MKNKKEIVILSLIFIAIIACIILLIVLKNKKTKIEIIINLLFSALFSIKNPP